MSKINKITVEVIKGITDSAELYDVVEVYLAKKGETENSRGETWGETAARLGGDVVLRAAEARWFELGA